MVLFITLHKILKATEQYFPAILFTLYKVVVSLESVTIQMKATEQYLPVVLFTILYKMVLTLEYVDEILKCNQSNESY